MTILTWARQPENIVGLVLFVLTVTIFIWSVAQL